MKSTVLVIDVQKGLFEAIPKPFEADEVVQRINHVTNLARTVGIPIVFIQSAYPGFLEDGSESWHLHSGLVVTDSDLKINKTKANAFLETGLQETLTGLGSDNLVICGYSTEFCIDSTVRYASALGYTIQLVSDAHTTHDKEHLSAKQIREHHNITLSKAPTISAIKFKDIELES
jgi:nicotinamidase-related amidase